MPFGSGNLIAHCTITNPADASNNEATPATKTMPKAAYKPKPNSRTAIDHKPGPITGMATTNCANWTPQKARPGAIPMIRLDDGLENTKPTATTHRIAKHATKKFTTAGTAIT